MTVRNVARGIIMANRFKPAAADPHVRHNSHFGTLGQFVSNDIIGDLSQFEEVLCPSGDNLGESAADSQEQRPRSVQGLQQTFTPRSQSPQMSHVSQPDPVSQDVDQLVRVQQAGGYTGLNHGSSSPLGGSRRITERVGEQMIKLRVKCPRHGQLAKMIPQLPGEPKLTKAAQKTLANKVAKAKEEEEARRKALEAQTPKMRFKEPGEAKAMFKAIGLEIIRRLQNADNEFLERVKRTYKAPVAHSKNENAVPVDTAIMEHSDDLERRPDRNQQQDPFHHHLKQALREPATPRRSARRDELALQGNFNPAFLADLGAKPRIDAQPLLAFMEQGDLVVVEQEDTAAEQVLMARRLESLRSGEPRRGPWVSPPESSRSQAEDAQGALRAAAPKRKAAAEPVVATKVSGNRVKKVDLNRMLELLDPEQKTGTINPDALVPLMFWLGLTKQRSAALTTLHTGFDGGEVSTDAMAVLSEHVEVQLRLVEGLRDLVRRESLDLLCEFMTKNNCQRIRTWFGLMRSDPFGCVDITQVQGLFSRMEVTSDRQTLFRFLSYMAEHPPYPVKTDPRELYAVENKKFSIRGFGSLLCRCTAAWSLHRTALLLHPNAPTSSPGLSDHELSCRWIQLQRKITISLLINQRFWGNESRNVLAAMQPPHGTAPAIEELKELTPEQWNVLFQRVCAQGLASVLLDDDEDAGQADAPRGAADAAKSDAGTPRKKT